MPLRYSLPAAALVLLSSLHSGATPAGAITLNVSAKANIFGAGHAAPPAPGGGGAGVLPAVWYFLPDWAQTLRITAVGGQVSCCGDLTTLANGADGGSHGTGATDILSYGGIGGVVHAGRTMFLVGVFTDGAEPVDPAPFRIDFGPGGIGDDFALLAPELNQVFFIGDGLTGTGTGVRQEVSIPPTAERLYLGFADSPAGAPSSLPGGYADNLGTITVAFQILTGQPTGVRPGTWGAIKSLYR